MTVQELRDLLEVLDAGDELRFAYQPSWPLAAKVAGIAVSSGVVDETTKCGRCGGQVEIDDNANHHVERTLDTEHHPDVEWDNDALEPGVVWLVAGEAPDDSPYAPRAAFTQAVR